MRVRIQAGKDAIRVDPVCTLCLRGFHRTCWSSSHSGTRLLLAARKFQRWRTAVIGRRRTRRKLAHRLCSTGLVGKRVAWLEFVEEKSNTPSDIRQMVGTRKARCKLESRRKCKVKNCHMNRTNFVLISLNNPKNSIPTHMSKIGRAD